MSANALAIRPEKAFREQEYRNLHQKLRQDNADLDAICICGTFFDPDSGPSPRMLSRMEHAASLLRNGAANTVMIAAGGVKGTGGALTTEAQLIGRTFQTWGFPRLYREEFSIETIGNVVFVALSILLPLGIRKVTFVTDTCHAPRVSAVARHLLGGYCTVIVSESPWPLSFEEECREREVEASGMAFVDQFIGEVPEGALIDAFDWVSENHKAHPYLGMNIAEIVSVLRGQFLDFGIVTMESELAWAS